MISARGIAKFLVALACLTLVRVNAFAQQAPPAFTQIILSGDSLSDTGNVRSRTNSKTSGAVDYPSHTFNYDNGRFTNDTATDPSSNTYIGVWHEQLARSFLGLPPATFSLGAAFSYPFPAPPPSHG